MRERAAPHIHTRAAPHAAWTDVRTHDACFFSFYTSLVRACNPTNIDGSAPASTARATRRERDDHLIAYLRRVQSSARGGSRAYAVLSVVHYTTHIPASCKKVSPSNCCVVRQIICVVYLRRFIRLPLRRAKRDAHFYSLPDAISWIKRAVRNIVQVTRLSASHVRQNWTHFKAHSFGSINNAISRRRCSGFFIVCSHRAIESGGKENQPLST